MEENPLSIKLEKDHQKFLQNGSNLLLKFSSAEGGYPPPTPQSRRPWL